MLAFFISIVAGLLLGVVCSMWVKLGFFVLGGWLGASTGMMAYEAVLSSLFGSGSKASTAMLIVIVISIIAGGVLMMYLFTHALIISTSVTGSYALIRVSTHTNLCFLLGFEYLHWWFPQRIPCVHGALEWILCLGTFDLFNIILDA